MKIGSANGQEFEYFKGDFSLSSLKKESDLEKSIKEILLGYNDYRETYPIIDTKNFLNENSEVFKVNSKKSDLIPLPKKNYFQIIQTHVASDASYNFNYSNDNSPLNVEYKNFKDWDVVTFVKGKKNEDIIMESDSTGPTFENRLILRYIDKKGEEQSRFVQGEIIWCFFNVVEELDDEAKQKLKPLAKKWYDILTNK